MPQFDELLKGVYEAFIRDRSRRGVFSDDDRRTAEKMRLMAKVTFTGAEIAATRNQPPGAFVRAMAEQEAAAMAETDKQQARNLMFQIGRPWVDMRTVGEPGQILQLTADGPAWVPGDADPPADTFELKPGDVLKFSDGQERTVVMAGGASITLDKPLSGAPGVAVKYEVLRGIASPSVPERGNARSTCPDPPATPGSGRRGYFLDEP